MKNRLHFHAPPILVLASLISFHTAPAGRAQTASPDAGNAIQQDNSGVPRISFTNSTVLSRDPHSTVWQIVTVDNAGNTNVSSYTELATGLNFWNPATKQFEASKEILNLTKEGYATATNGQSSLILAPDIASAGAVDLLNPDGIRLISNPMGLSYADSSSGKNVLIAQVTNSLGELASDNSVLYPQAFDSIRAAIRITYTRSGIEQDVILYQQLPTPEQLGLDPASTKLQMWTEVINQATPQISATDSIR